MSDEARLYFEAHVTLKPLEGDAEKLHDLLELTEKEGWRRSTFVMNSANNVPNEFISTRRASMKEMKKTVRTVVTRLEIAGFSVLRWKIEDTLFDSNRGDSLSQLN